KTANPRTTISSNSLKTGSAQLFANLVSNSLIRFSVATRDCFACQFNHQRTRIPRGLDEIVQSMYRNPITEHQFANSPNVGTKSPLYRLPLLFASPFHFLST